MSQHWALTRSLQNLHWQMACIAELIFSGTADCHYGCIWANICIHICTVSTQAWKMSRKLANPSLRQKSTDENKAELSALPVRKVICFCDTPFTGSSYRCFSRDPRQMYTTHVKKTVTGLKPELRVPNPKGRRLGMQLKPS